MLPSVCCSLLVVVVHCVVCWCVVLLGVVLCWCMDVVCCMLFGGVRYMLCYVVCWLLRCVVGASCVLLVDGCGCCVCVLLVVVRCCWCLDR